LTKILIAKGAKSAILILIVTGLYLSDRVYGMFEPQQIPTELYIMLLSTMFKDNKMILAIAKYFLNKPTRKGN